MSRPSLERRVLGLVGSARLAIHDYGMRALREAEIDLLARVFNIEVCSAVLSIPVLTLPPIEGKFHVVLQVGLARSVRHFIILHELGHVLAGESDEPMRMLFIGPLPESEDMCDLFALLGIIDPAHDSEGSAWVEGQIRAGVPLDDRGWQVHRIPRLAKKLPQVREMVSELHGYF